MKNMKITLDLGKSYNHKFRWVNKTELNDYIKYMLNELWDMYNELENIMSENKKDRLFDLLDMFTSYEIEEVENDK